MQKIIVSREQHKGKNQGKKKMVWRDKSSGSDSVMIHMLELSGKEFKIAMIDKLKAF